VEVSTAQFLLTPEGRALVTEVAAELDNNRELAVAERFRRRHPADRVAAALTQVELRTRAQEKFGADAAVLLFTPAGLEQATHRLVAEHRAARIARAGGGGCSPTGSAAERQLRRSDGVRSRAVLDLCCGIGADLIAFARSGAAVVGVDRDPVAVELARANLRVLGLRGDVELGDAATYARRPDAVTYADPARRGVRGRVFDPRQYSPAWPVIEELLRGDAVVKLAPGIAHELVPADVEAEWVSLGGQLREAALWSGGLAERRRRATVLSTSAPTVELTDADDPGPVAVHDVGDFVFEPDDAVIRAHLVTAFAARVDGWLLDSHLAYVSAPEPSHSPLGRCYRVLEVLPFKEKVLRSALHQRHIGTLTIKKRGVAITPEVLRQRLKLRGSAAATIILTRTPKGSLALLVEPLPAANPTPAPG
jgi:SAM-dependent methyltransferase